MSTQKNNGPTKYANSNLNNVFAKSSTSTSASSTGPSVNKYNGMLVLSKQRLRPSSTAAGPKLAVPKPVNLPSMRKEHAGNDPTTVLVPSGGTSSGWNKPEETSTQSTDSNRTTGVAPGASWATSRTQSPAWAPTPSEAAKAAQLQAHGRAASSALDRHLNPEEYPSLGATARTQSQPLPRRSPFHEANQDHLWTDDERNVPSAAPYKQSGQDWSRDADDDRYVSRTPWDSGKGSSNFFNSSRSFSTGELHDDYVPRRFDFDAPPPPPPPARRPGAAAVSKESSRFAPGFDYYHDEAGLFPPPPPPPGRPHDGLSDKSDEEDLERNAFYETLDQVAAELQKRKEETEKEKEKELQLQLELEQELEQEKELEAAAPSPEPQPEPESEPIQDESPPPPPKSAAAAVKADLEDSAEKQDASKSDTASDTPTRNKLVIQPRKTQRELEYEEEEKRRKAAAAEKLRQLEERMERQRREKEEAEAKAWAEEEAAKKAAAIALHPPSQQSTPLSAAAPGSGHSIPEPSGLSTPTEEDAEAWGEKGFKAEEEKPLVMEEEEEDAEPPKPAEPHTPAEPTTADAESNPEGVNQRGNAWQRGPPIQTAGTTAVSMAARFGTFDDDLLEDINKAAKQQTTGPKSKPSQAQDAQAPQRSTQGSWRAQPKGEEPADYETLAGFERGGRRGGRGGRGSRGGRTPDSGTPRSSRNEIDARGTRGKNTRVDRGGRGAERGSRPLKEEPAAASDAKPTASDAATTPALASAESGQRVDTAPTTDQTATEPDAKGRRPSNGRMNKDALVPAPSSSSISKAPGAGRGKNERFAGGKTQTTPASAANPDSAAQAAAAVAAAVAGVSTTSTPQTTPAMQANSSSASLLTPPALLSPRAPAPALPTAPSPAPQGRSLDSRSTNPTVDVKVPAPIGPSAQPSPQPIARSPVISSDPTGLWAGPNIVKDINISLGPLTGNDPVHLSAGIPPSVKPVQLGASLQGFDRQVGPRQGGAGNKDMSAGSEPLAGDVLGNGMPKFPENLMDMVQPQQKPPGPPIPFPPPPGGSNMVRPLGPNSFPFHAGSEPNSGSAGASQGANTLNLWGPTPLNFGQHPAGAMHNSSQPAPTAIGNALESFYPAAMFPNSSLPMHPPATPNSPNPHANPALMNPVLAGLHQYSQHFPNLYAPHTQFGTMGTTFGQFPNQAFIPTGKQPDWSTPNPIGIPSTNPVLNPGLVRPPGLDNMLPGPYPLSGTPSQGGMASDAVSHYSSSIGQSLGAPQQVGLQPGVQGMGNSNTSSGYSNMIPGPKQGSSNMPMKLSQGSGNNMMLGGHHSSQQTHQLQSHGKQDPAPITKGVPQLPDDVFPGMEPSSSVTVNPLQSHANGNGKVDSQPSSKQSTPPGLAPPQASQQAAQNQHQHHHSHQSYGGGNERQSGGHHDQPSQHSRGITHVNNSMPPAGPKHGGRGRGSNPAGPPGGRSERMGGRGSNRSSRSPVRSSENSGGRARPGSGSARSTGTGTGSTTEKVPTGAPPAAAAAAAAAAVAALNTSGPAEGGKQAPMNANSGPPPQSARPMDGGGRGGRGRGGPGRGPGGRSRGPPGGPKTMYVPKGTIPPNAQIKTEAS